MGISLLSITPISPLIKRRRNEEGKMPPKKKAEAEPTVILGRLSSNLRMGCVGLPNVGKSSLFNVLTKMDIPAENFPFCTIDPNVSRVAVPDPRFDWLCELYKPASEVCAFLQITDIAGLVKGASEGEGLGNAFLSHINAVDGIFHVLRLFDDPDVTHVEDSVDPVRDADIINRELLLKDKAHMQKLKDGMAKVNTKDKKKLEEKAMCEKVWQHLEDGNQIRFGKWNAKEIEYLNGLPLLTSKPVVYLLNLSEKDFIRKKNKWLPKLKAWSDAHGGENIIPISVAFEQKVLGMDDDAKKAYFEETKTKSMLDKIIQTGYNALNLIHFFTCGADEVRCWTIRKGYKAPKAAGTIHTDFEKGFVCAEVTPYADLKEAGSEQAAKVAGKTRQQGKTYEVQDGDIMFIRANTGAGLNKKK